LKFVRLREFSEHLPENHSPWAAVRAGDIPANVRANGLAFRQQKMRKIAVFLLSLISQAAS
jgi:hypothetical protein